MAAEVVKPLRVEPVGWCADCGERSYLALAEGRRSVVCGCGTTVPERVFAAGAFGRADATSSLERIGAARVVGDEERATELERVTGRTDEVRL